MAGKTTQEAIKLSGLTRRQLWYWRNTGLFVPHLTRGGHARYSDADVRGLRLARVLRENGVSTQHLRRLLPALSAFIASLGEENA